MSSATRCSSMNASFDRHKLKMPSALSPYFDHKQTQKGTSSVLTYSCHGHCSQVTLTRQRPLAPLATNTHPLSTVRVTELTSVRWAQHVWNSHEPERNSGNYSHRKYYLYEFGVGVRVILKLILKNRFNRLKTVPNRKHLWPKAIDLYFITAKNFFIRWATSGKILKQFVNLRPAYPFVTLSRGVRRKPA